MHRPALLLLALVALAVLGRLDRDGILAHTDAVARAVGVELRVEVTVRRTHPKPAARPAIPDCALPNVSNAPGETPPCE
jgi:hypothetical protein